MRRAFQYIALTMCPFNFDRESSRSGGAIDGSETMCKHTIQLAAVVILTFGLIAPAVWAQNTVQTIGGGGPNNLPALKASMGDPIGIALDGAGNVYATDVFSNRVFKVDSTGNVTVVAGDEARGGFSIDDGGPAISATLTYPSGVAVDSFGNIFIADRTYCRIREVSAQTGNISTVAGTGTCGYSGDGGGGPASSATLKDPSGVAVDRFGNIFIADTSNCVIREVSSSNVQISTVAGNYSLGCGYSGDGTSATSAQINQPYSVAVDSAGNIFVADYANSVIREISASSGDISTFAGVAVPDPNRNGHLVGLPAFSGDGYLATEGELGFLNDTPYGAGLATDSAGNVFIADTANNAVRKISAATGIMTTVAGNGLIGYSGDGGPAASAQLFYPRDVAVDGLGNIFIMDTGNCVIRKVTASTGVITTVAGTPPNSSGKYYCGYSGDGGPAISAELYPIDLLIPAGGVAVDSSGNIFIADTGNAVIREVSAATGIITTVAGIANSVNVGGGDGGPATGATLFSPYGVVVDGSGNIFIADTYDFAIREVMAVNGNIYTVAGNTALGIGFSGDGGPAGSAQIGYTFGIFLDPAGNLFIPDPGNCVMRQVSASTGIISTVAGMPNRSGDYFCGYSGDGGPALSTIFDFPSAAGANPSGELVVLDGIRVRTVAGLAEETGTGAVLFPSPLAFSDVPLGASSTLTVMLSNRGSLANSVSTVAVSGANVSDFSETDSCAGHSLAGGGGSCAINVKFTPSVAASESALLTVTDSAGTQTVDLIGTAVDAPEFSLSAATLPFGNQQESIKGSPMSVTVTNNGNAGLMVSSVAVNGANAGDFAISANTCSAGTVAVNTSCSVSVTFRPTTTGAETASLQFTDNAPSSPQSVGLTGTGTDFSIGFAPGGSATATVPAGSPATYNLEVTPINGFSGTVALSCTGAPSESTCMPSEASATPSGNTAAAFSVQVTTTAPSITPPGVGRQLRPFDGLRVLPLVFMSALALTLLAFASRFRGASAQQRCADAFAIPLGFLLLTSALLAGCSGGSGSGGTGPTNRGTPKGTYSLTITGTSNGVSHSQMLTLTVN
jgi:hypothetical protein